MTDKKTKKAKFDTNLIRKLAELLDETGLNEIEYGTEDLHLRVAKGTSNPTTQSVLSSAPKEIITEEVDNKNLEENKYANHPGIVISPIVGTAYISPDPDSAPFVKVGDTVSVGDTLILIEAMKVFNPIKAAHAGTVTRVFINNGTPIEFGEPLLIIE